MTGLHAITAGHRSIQERIAALWRDLHADGKLQCPFDSGTHHVLDIMTFFSLVIAYRKTKAKRVVSSERFQRLVWELLVPLLGWAADVIDAYVLRVFSADNPSVHRAPPSLKTIASSSGTRRAAISPEASWELMEKAQVARVSMAQAIALGSDDARLGCCTSTAYTWTQKLNQLYMHRCSVFTQANHWCMVADPGTHAYKDLMVSALYSWELDAACFPQFQHLIPGKVITARDCNADEDILSLSFELKLERVAAYRQLQGLAHNNSSSRSCCCCCHRRRCRCQGACVLEFWGSGLLRLFGFVVVVLCCVCLLLRKDTATRSL